MKQKKNTSRFHTIVIVCLVLFLLATLISILFIILDSYGVLSKEPEVTIKANNTYTETLHVATDHDYKPFSYIENGEYLGLDVEMIAEVANRMEMNLELELLDWEDAQSGLLSGRYDVILNMESKAILNNHEMIGTIPTDEKQYVVYGKNVIAHIGELYGMRVAAYNKFDELGINVLTGDSYQVMFEKLLNDELDYIICPIQVGDS
ncbi:MAG: transporter substrate-binding domain-containing protein, partial [bacterium]|nr:transporter substrate-binding domain-containing protein [bacterium]